MSSGSLFDDEAVDEKPQPVQSQPPQAVPYTWTEAWRRECEARHVRRMSFREREDYLKRVAGKRGAAAGEQLRRDVEGQR